jgi:ankyrin repeat protein
MKHENDINQELGRLPTTLRTSYDLIYQQIIDLGATSRGIVERTLSWLLSAQRTLKPKEIIAAVSLGSDGIQIPLNVDQLLGMCCNLVLLDEEIKTLRFAHLSVREYLEDHGDYDASRRHALVLDRCLNTYLLHLSKISKLARFSQSAFDRDHLSRYSTIYWPIHCQLAGGILPNFRPTKKLLRFVFEGSGPALSFQAWTIYGRSVLSPTLPINLRDRLTWIFLSPPHPLFSACSFGFCWVFDTLTELGYSDWNQWGHECRSGLHVAAEYGLSNAITLLMNRGVDVNAVDGKYFRSAISWAAENAHAESVELLLDHGAMVGSNSGKPPLMCAAKNGDQKMVELLLSRGADPDKEGDSYMNRTALGWAVYNGHRAIVELLLNASGNGKMLYSLKAALMSAAQSGHYDILELLLGKGRKADIKEEDMSAMLLKATANRHTAVVDLLLRKGAWTETRTFEGKTPLILAAQDGHCRIMQLLLDSGAHIDHRNESGESALLIAVEKGDIEVVKLLLARGASVNQRDRSGESALLRAAVNGNMALVELLLSKGASIDIKDKGTGSALLRAAERGNVTSVKLLLSRGANIEAKTPRAVTPLIMAAQLGHEKVVEVLLSNQANIEAETMEGKTPLILAAQYGYEKIVEILLLNRATIDARDSDGNTPLLKASSKRIIELLISKGADVKDANQEGITLLHLASTGLHAASRSGDGKLVELLLSKGAVKMQEDAIGRTAYDMALNNSNFAVLELLNDWQRKPLGLDEYSGALIFSPKVYGHFRDIMSRAALVLSRGIPSDEPQTPVTGEKDEFTKRLRRLRRRRRLITYELITDVSDQDSRRHETNTADADVPKYPAYYDNTPFNPDPNEADEGPEIVQQLLLEWSPLQTNRKERMEWIVLASLYLTTFIIVVFPAILVFPSVTTDILWYFILFCASIFLVHLCGGLEKFNNTKGVLQFRHQEVGDIRLRN